MGNRVAANWQERGIVAVPAIFTLGLLLILPGLTGQPLLHDSHELNPVWADQFTAQLRQGVLYPRWLPDSHDGLGSPTFYFYPPLAFHAAGLIGLLGLSVYHSLMAAFGAFFALSGCGMWLWLRRRAAQPLLGALIFMALPYHVMDFSLRGALAESLGFALLPWIAIGLRRIAEQRSGTLLALAYGALIMSHLPLALLTGFFLIAPYAIWHRSRLVPFLVSVGLGIGLASITWLPALGLEPFRDTAHLYRGANLTPEDWSLWRSSLTDESKLVFRLLCVSIVLPLLFLTYERRDGWAIGGAGIALIALGVVPLLWSLPLLEKVQFPWRSLALAEFALATVVARRSNLSLGLLLTLVPAAALSALFLIRVPTSPTVQLNRLLQTHPDVYEMLPPGVVETKRNGLMPATAELHRGRIPPPEVAGMIVRPVFYFPRWSCGEPEPRTKLLMHRPDCSPRPVVTGWEKGALALSLLSLLLITGLPLAARRRAS